MRARRAGRVALREARSVLASPGGAFVVGTFWLLVARFFVKGLFDYRDALVFQAQRAGLGSGPMGLPVGEFLVYPFLINVGGMLLFFVPLLTMRSFAEERRTGNLELLMSQPIRGVELLLGKFLGSVLALLGCYGILVFVGVALGMVTAPDWAGFAAGLLGLVLMGVFFTAVAVLLSVISRSQVEAAVLSLGVLLLTVLGPRNLTQGPDWIRGVAGFVSVLDRFDDFARGIVDLGHVAFFLGLSLIVLALALRSLDLVRWQG